MHLYQNLGIDANGNLTRGLVVFESSLYQEYLRWVGKDILKGLSTNDVTCQLISERGDIKKKIHTTVAASASWVAQRRV